MSDANRSERIETILKLAPLIIRVILVIRDLI